jgi:Flp pilus assembly protein TadB
VLFEKIIICVLLFAAFVILFAVAAKQRVISGIIKKTGESMNDSAVKRLSVNRQRLQQADRSGAWWTAFEHELCYSGLQSAFPFITVEIFITANACGSILIFTAVSVLFNVFGGCAAVILCLLTELLAFRLARLRNIKKVNDNILKLLDFLGSYSITSGELTGILGQTGRYVDEPLKSALEECCYEAHTTGDAGTALLSMAEKIEHPQFKELARNMEINIRYCGDFTALVSGSRRGMRDYLRTSQERKSMLREAAVNMLLLIAMSAFSLIIVDGLIEESIWNILIYSVPGRAAMAVTALILLLFAGQVYKNQTI